MARRRDWDDCVRDWASSVVSSERGREVSRLMYFDVV